MTDPEYFFDDTNPGDYPLFGIGYILTPASMAPPVPAEKVRCTDSACLWALPDPGYIHVYDTTGVLTATRANVGSQSVTLLDSPLLGRAARPHGGLQRAGGVRPHGRGRDHAARAAGPRGRASTPTWPTAGAGAVVRTSRRATVVLERVLRPRLARHGRRPPDADGHGGARAGRRRGRPGRAHRRLQLRRLRLLRRALRPGAGRLRRPRPWRRWSGAGCGRRRARAGRREWRAMSTTSSPEPVPAAATAPGGRGGRVPARPRRVRRRHRARAGDGRPRLHERVAAHDSRAGPARAASPARCCGRAGWASGSTSTTWPPRATWCSPTGSTSSASGASPRGSGSTGASSSATAGSRCGATPSTGSTSRSATCGVWPGWWRPSLNRRMPTG